MSLASPRLALSSLTGNSPRLNNVSQGGLKNGEKTPSSVRKSPIAIAEDLSASVRRKNAQRASERKQSAAAANEAPFSDEFFSSREIFGRSGVLSKVRGRAPPDATAFGVDGVLERDKGHAPPEAEIWGESGVLTSERGPSLSLRERHAAEAASEAASEAAARQLADFLQQHSDAELIPGGKVRCATTGVVVPLSLHWLEAHWSGHKYRRAATHAAAAALQAELWTKDDVARIDAARMDNIFRAQAAVSAAKAKADAKVAAVGGRGADAHPATAKPSEAKPAAAKPAAAKRRLAPVPKGYPPPFGAADRAPESPPSALDCFDGQGTHDDGRAAHEDDRARMDRIFEVRE